eukprot:symbB.v1.2.014501.t1/scaffold1061.1/size140413/7
MKELEHCRHNACDARRAGRHPTAEERCWERAYYIAAAASSQRSSDFEALRALEDSHVWLTQTELSGLCARICGKRTPVVQVTPDWHGALETGDHTMLAMACKGVPVLEEALSNKEDDFARLGLQLHRQGYHVITAEDVSKDEFLSVRPLIIHLGTHYFILEEIQQPRLDDAKPVTDVKVDDALATAVHSTTVSEDAMPPVPGVTANLVVKLDSEPEVSKTEMVEENMKQSDQEDLCGEGSSVRPIDASKGSVEMTLPAEMPLPTELPSPTSFAFQGTEQPVFMLSEELMDEEDEAEGVEDLFSWITEVLAACCCCGLKRPLKRKPKIAS